MHAKIQAKYQGLDPKQKKLTAVAALIVVAFILFLIFHAAAPQRSVAAYCDAFKQEKARIAKLPGDTWPSGVFNDSISDAGEFAKSFSRLDKVAPGRNPAGRGHIAVYLPENT